jgi:hypothetical protein
MAMFSSQSVHRLEHFDRHAFATYVLKVYPDMTYNAVSNLLNDLARTGCIPRYACRLNLIELVLSLHEEIEARLNEEYKFDKRCLLHAQWVGSLDKAFEQMYKDAQAFDLNDCCKNYVQVMREIVEQGKNYNGFADGYKFERIIMGRPPSTFKHTYVHPAVANSVTSAAFDGIQANAASGRFDQIQQQHMDAKKKYTYVRPASASSVTSAVFDDGIQAKMVVKMKLLDEIHALQEQLEKRAAAAQKRKIVEDEMTKKKRQVLA